MKKYKFLILSLLLILLASGCSREDTKKTVTPVRVEEVNFA